MENASSTREWAIETIAGTGEPGYSCDGSDAKRARLNNPFDLALLPDGNLIFSDTYNHRLRRIDTATWIIATICGTGAEGFSGDGGPALQARLNQPYGVVADRNGRTFFADRLNRRVRQIDAGGTITTLAELVEPNGLALNPDQTMLFIADVAGHRVHVADLRTGAVAIYAGTGEARHDGDGGPVEKASIFGARAVAFAPDGSLYIMERQGSCIRRVRGGIIETVAGTGARGFAGDGGDARQAVFDAPKEMAVSPEGHIYVVDTENNRIRRIDAKTWIVETIASGLARPHGALVAPDGSVLVGDSEHHRICRLLPP
jgi:DNA-binding beta-propeller fold protein YncE